jgi:tetratricopeptide (TPR) repeat protein
MRPAFSLALAALWWLAAAPAWAADCPPEPRLSRPAHRALFQAQKLVDQGADAEARRALQAYARAADRPDHRASLLLGVLHHQAGNTGQAAEHFAAAARAWPCFAEAWRNLAVVRFEQGRAAEAAELMHKAWRLMEPRRDQVLYEAAAMHLAADQPGRALPLLAELAGRSEPRDQWLKALVQAHLALGRPARAEPVLRRLLARRPGQELLWRLLASVRLEQEDYGGAAAALEVASRLEPPDAAGWRRLAELHRAAGAPAQAAEHYRRAFGPSPDPAQRELLARVLAQARQDRAALEEALAAARAAPTSRRWSLAGRLQMRLRRYPAAAGSFARAAKLRRKDPARLWLLAGHCALRARQWEEARRLLGKARRTAAPDSPRAREAAQALRSLEEQRGLLEEGATAR